MNLRILLKSFRLAFRSKRRVFAFIIIYAILYIVVGRNVANPPPEGPIPYLFMAWVVATVYAVLISQFRRRDIAILKCVSWANREIMILLTGEVVIVAVTAFLLVFELSVQILGMVAYFGTDFGVLNQLRDLIVIPPPPMLTALFYIVILQLFGLLLAQYRATKIPPMKALREE